MVTAFCLSTYAKKRPTKGRFLYGYALHEHCQRALVCNYPVAYDCGNGSPKVPFMWRITSEDRGDARLVKEMEELSWNGRLKMQGLFRHGVDKFQNACMECKSVNGCFCKAVFPVR